MLQLRSWGLWLSLFFILVFPAQAVQDHWGRELSWPKHPERILSLSPATTEMMYALGAQDLLVGITEDCNYPPEAKSKARVGRFGQIQLEHILKLKPDLILVTADMGQALEPLHKIPVPILAFKTPDVQAIYTNIKTLGQLTGHSSEAHQRVAEMQKIIAGIQSPKPAPKVLYMVSEQPLIVAAPSSFIGDALKLSGAQNIIQAKSAPFIHYSLETLLKSDPEVLIMPLSMSKRLDLNRPPFNRLSAVKQKHLLFIEDDLIERPGPRVVLAIQQIHQYLSTLSK